MGKKRKFAPEADENDKQIRPSSKMAKTKGLPSITKDKERAVKVVKKDLAMTKESRPSNTFDKEENERKVEKVTFLTQSLSLQERLAFSYH